MPATSGDVIKCTARMELLGGIAVQNVFWVQLTSAGPVSDADLMDDLAEWLDDTFTYMISIISTALTFVDIVFYHHTDQTPIGINAWPVLAAGSDATDLLVTGGAAVMTAYTAINRVRARKFVGGLTEAAVTNALMVAGTITQMILFAASWITPFTGGTSGASWLPGVVRTSTGAFQPFTSVVARNVPGYQRRRKENVGI